MSTISLPNTFSNGQTADASQANSNFTTIYNDYNGSISNVNLASNAAIAATKLNLTTIAQTIAMSSNPINWAKGADIASATTTDIGAATGNVVDVTGTTTITGLGTVQSGTFRIVRFTGALTLTYNATSLILPGSTSITTANGDCAGFESLGSGNWKCVFYQKQDGTAVTSSTASGAQIQSLYTNLATYSSNATAIPYDDTIPQITEGVEIMTQAITPGNASNTLEIEAIVYGGTDGASAKGCIALFQDATANALACGFASEFANDNAFIYIVKFSMAAGTTSSTTFRIRVGADTGNFFVNGVSARKYGGVCISSLRVKEFKA